VPGGGVAGALGAGVLELGRGLGADGLGLGLGGLGIGGGQLLAEDRELVQGRGQLRAEPAHRRQGVVADRAGPADRRGDRPAAVIRLSCELPAAAERRQRGVPHQREGAVAVLGHLLPAVAGLPARRPGVFGRVRAAGIPACPGFAAGRRGRRLGGDRHGKRVLSRSCWRTAERNEMKRISRREMK
jgi:hypothetical protein